MPEQISRRSSIKIYESPLHRGSQHGSPAFRKKKLLRSGSSKVRSVQGDYIWGDVLKGYRFCKLKIERWQYFYCISGCVAHCIEGHSMGRQPPEKRNCSGAPQAKSGLYKAVLVKELSCRVFIFVIACLI